MRGNAATDEVLQRLDGVDHAFLMLALRLLLSQPAAAVDGLQPQDGPQNQLVSLPPFGTYLVAEFYKPVMSTCTCTAYEYLARLNLLLPFLPQQECHP